MQESYIDQEGGGWPWTRTAQMHLGNSFEDGLSRLQSNSGNIGPIYNVNGTEYNPENREYGKIYKKIMKTTISESRLNQTKAYLSELDVPTTFAEEEIKNTNMAYIEMYHIFSRIFSTPELEQLYVRIVLLLIYKTHKDTETVSDTDLDDIYKRYFKNNMNNIKASFGFIYLYIDKYADIRSSTSKSITDIEQYINNMDENSRSSLQWCYDYITSMSMPLTNEKKTKIIEFNIKSLNPEATSGGSTVLLLNRNTADVLQNIPWEVQGENINVNMVIIIYDKPVLTPESQQILSYYLTKCDSPFYWNSHDNDNIAEPEAIVPSATTSKENVERAAAAHAAKTRAAAKAAVGSGENNDNNFKNFEDEDEDDEVNLLPPPQSAGEAAVSELANNNRDLLQAFSGSGGAAAINSQEGSAVGTKAGPDRDKIKRLVDDLLEDGNETTDPSFYCFFNYVKRRKTKSHKEGINYIDSLNQLFPDENAVSNKNTLKQIYDYINYIKELYDHIDEKSIILYIHTFINFSITRDIKKDILNDNMDKKRFDELVGEIYCNNSSDEMSGGAEMGVEMGKGLVQYQPLLRKTARVAQATTAALAPQASDRVRLGMTIAAGDLAEGPLPEAVRTAVLSSVNVSTIPSSMWQKIVATGDFLMSNLTVENAQYAGEAAVCVAGALAIWKFTSYRRQKDRIKTIISRYSRNGDYKHSLFLYNANDIPIL